MDNKSKTLGKWSKMNKENVEMNEKRNKNKDEERDKNKACACHSSKNVHNIPVFVISLTTFKRPI